MEICARYTLIGAFTLAVIAAGFAFVYWLNTIAGLGQRIEYRIRYDSPVAGLLNGSAVLFNGIRVGEVIGLKLDPAAPGDVTVEIAIDRNAPIRSDTRVGIDFQGLAGAPVVSMAGGTSSLPLLGSGKGKPPLLVAEKNAGIGMTQAARDVLRRIDAVVSENAEPVRNLIANIDKFSGALARNTERVDGIILGLERLTGGGVKLQPRVFDFAAANEFPGLTKRPTNLLQILEPTALAELDTERILVRRSDPSEAPALAGANWPDMLPKVVQVRIVQSFENALYTNVAGRVPDGIRGDFQLLIDIRKFQLNLGTVAAGEVELAVRIVGADGRIVGARIFRATTPLAALDTEAGTKALGDAFKTIASEIVLWTCAAI